MKPIILLFISIFISHFLCFAQISVFPYAQDFEAPFENTGTDVAFLPDWTGNEVKSSGRVFQSDAYARSGTYALAIQPISSFNGEILVALDFSSLARPVLEFYAVSRKNGWGTRPVMLKLSTSLDGGASFMGEEILGDKLTFPNSDTTAYQLFSYTFPLEASNRAAIMLKIEVMYGAESGAGTAARLLIDDVSIKEGSNSLQLTAVNALSNREVEINFNQDVDLISASDTNNYHISNGIGNPVSAERNVDDKTSVSLRLNQNLQEGEYELMVTGVQSIDQDLIAVNLVSTFSFKDVGVPPGFNDLIITEIMASPSVSAGLPDAEYLEIFNRSGKNISLKDCKISDGSNSAVLPEIIIAPNTHIILCPESSANAFAPFGPALGLNSWPLLNNGGDHIVFANAANERIFDVEYDDDWYKNSDKAKGGWSLEMLDINNFCAGNTNWAASEDPAGGTPGRTNSVAAPNPDLTGPRLVSAIAINPLQLKLVFNEKIDISSFTFAAISFNKGISAVGFFMDSANAKAMWVTLSGAIEKQEIYEVKILAITDCVGNTLSKEDNSASFALPEPAIQKDVVVNEMLFNARTGGVKFIEAYNQSNKYINIKGWKLANVEHDTIINEKTISADAIILPPRSFIVFTTSPEILKADYPRGKEKNFIEIDAFPDYTQTEGNIALVNDTKVLIDHAAYDEKDHVVVLKSVKGVSLERISFHGSSTDKSNWHSAAATAGFATPGYMNSQSVQEINLSANVQIDPPIFVPGQSGLAAAFTTIHYNFPTPGNVANVIIYNVQGRKVRMLAQNELLGTQGSFSWNGTDDAGKEVIMGNYLIMMELYNLNGQVNRIKNKVAVGKIF